MAEQKQEGKPKRARRQEAPPPIETPEQVHPVAVRGAELKRKADAIEQFIDETLASYEKSGFGLAQNYVQRGGE
jgi:hypothetical protein